MYKVIIVEDEVAARRGLLLTVPWQELNCVVVGDAEDGEEGLALILRHNPDLVLTDVRMPKMTGVDMALKARDKGSQAEFIILSAYEEFAYAQKALRAGAAEYLLKPFSDEDLIFAIREVTDRLDNKLESRHSPLLRENIAKGEKSKYVNLALKYIEEHYQDPDLTVTGIAEELGISDGYLSRVFRKETEYTLVNYLTRYRLQIAMELLRDITVKVYEVADQVGYLDTAYFSTQFKRYYGVTPSDYQDRSHSS